MRVPKLLKQLAIVFTASCTSALTATAQQPQNQNPDVITHPINTDGATDLARIPYAAELNLEGLSRGKYVLQLTVIDRIAKATASQRVRFQVD